MLRSKNGRLPSGQNAGDDLPNHIRHQESHPSPTPRTENRLPENERSEFLRSKNERSEFLRNQTRPAKTAPPPQGHRADVLAAVATPQPYRNETHRQTAPSPLALVQKLWAEQPAPAFADTASLQQHAADCTACPLHSERKQALSGRGSIPAKLMVISRNPAPSDDEAGQLLAGRHGLLLDNMLAAIHLAPEQVFRTAWQRCTPRVSLKPTPEEQVRCAAFIRQEAAWVRPQALLLLGNSFYDPVQQWLSAQIAPGAPAFIVPHPAILLRQPELKTQAWATLKQLQHYLSKS
nr:uracil-DNA glycosylase [Eikenella glucosivorans]